MAFDPFERLSRPIAGRTVPAQAIELVRACLDRIVQVQFVDRAVALGSLSFTALIPLLLIAGAFLPGGESLADALIDRFRLTGDNARLVETVFAQPTTTRESVSWLSVLLLIGSALSFTRALQRLFELSWRLPMRSYRGTLDGLKWLLGVVVWVTLFASARRWLVDETGPFVALVIALAGGFAVWMLTPFVLLGRRVPWRKLLPTAILTSVAMTALNIGSIIYMPDAIASSADRYGPIGIAIALLSWLVGAGFALVACAAIGAVLGGERDMAPVGARAAPAGADASPPDAPPR
jgi:membrane protein